NNPEIILIDEILAVGDEEFQKKSLNRIRLMKEQGNTMVLVSHDMYNIKAICDKTIYLEHGIIKNYGITKDVVSHYLTNKKPNNISNYILLKKNFKKYQSIENKISKLEIELKNKIKLPIISNFTENKLKQQLDELRYKEVTLKSELVDLCDSLIIIFEPFEWLEYKIKNLSPQQKREMLEKLEQSEEALRIKQLLTKKLLEFDEILLNIKIQEIKFHLYVTLEKNKKTITDLLTIYRDNVNNLNKSETVYIQIYLNDIILSLRIDKFELNLISYTLNEFKKVYEKAKHFDKHFDYIGNLVQFNSILRRLLYEADELVSAYKIELEDSTIINKKGIKKKLKNLILFKRDIINLYMERERDTIDNAPIKIINLVFKNSEEETVNVFNTGDQIKITIKFKTSTRLEKPVFGISIHKDDGTQITGPNTKFHNVKIPYVEGEGSISYIINKLPLLEGTYLVTVAVHPYNSFKPYDVHDKKYSFEVISKDIKDLGIIYIDSRWELND
ncbi:MAG: Wzt carbohydrate-binding domain-containing protein, partial [Nanoarchaeota archaeon]